MIGARHIWRVLAFIKGAEWYGRKVGVSIGSGCRIYTVSFGSEPFLVSIGDRVTVTAGVRFVTHDGATWLVRDKRGRRLRFAPITVADDVFIGVNSVILPGVAIGARCIVGAGSVVTRSIPSGTIVAGVPAKAIGEFADYEKRALAQNVAEGDLPSRNALPYEEWVSACLRAQDKLREG